MSNTSALLVIYYTSFFISIFLARSYLWKALPLVFSAFLLTAVYFRNLLDPQSKFLWGVILCVLAFLLLALSPLQLLLAREKREIPKTLEVLYPQGGDEDATEFRMDIVAVHGLGSSPKRAWVHKGTKMCWLSDFLPKDIKGVRVLAFNHDSGYSHDASKLSLPDYSLELLRALDGNRKSQEERDRPIIFIAHSFGGLLIKRALVQAKSSTESYSYLQDMVKGAVFLGTPHHGSSMSKLAKIEATLSYWAGSRTELLELLTPGSQENQQLNEDYIRAYDQIEHVDFYETKEERLPWLGIKTGVCVDKTSAILSVGKSGIPLAATHRELNKFPNLEDPNYLRVKNEIVRIWNTDQKPSQQEAQNRTAVLKWLMPSEFDAEDDDYVRKRTLGTCRWPCEMDEFKIWDASSKSGDELPVLYILGKPGCGKSFIAQYMRRKLQEDTSPVVYFHFDSKRLNSDKSTALAFFRTIIYQLLKQTTHIAAVKASFKKAIALMQEKDADTKLSDFRKLLEEILSEFKEVRLVVDALDECAPGPDNRAHVKYFISSTRCLRSIVTSRPEPDILKDALNQKEACKSAVTEVRSETTDADISLYIRERLKKIQSVRGHPLLQKKIEQRLKEQAQGTFLYVRLVLDQIEQEAETAEEIEVILDGLPDDLQGLYKQALEKIQRDHKKDPPKLMRCVSIFHWLLTAQRPLKVEGLHLALRAEKLNGKKHPTNADLGAKLLNPGGVIQKACFPLVEILADKTVRIVHFSVAQYLRKGIRETEVAVEPPNDSQRYAHDRAILRNSLEVFYYEELPANSKVAVACVLYLSITMGATLGKEQPKPVPITARDQDSECYDFLSYAVAQWPSHLLRSEEDFGIHRETLIKFCNADNPAFTAWIRDRASLDGLFRVTFRLETGATILPSPLHVTAYCRLEQLSEGVIGEDEFATRATDATGATPLHIAAEQGSGPLVKLFLENLAVRDARDENKQTPLHRAATNGHLSPVEELLKGDEADPDPRDRYNRTPLFLASLYGKPDAARELLKHGASPECESIGGETPLTAAIINDHVSVVQVLLDASRGGDSDDFRLPSTAVNSAAWKGYYELLKLLLENRVVDLTATDSVKQTALHAAATSGHEDVVELLLRFEAEVDALEQSDRTPLYFAAENGRLGIVKQLLKAGAHINALDRRNQTVLFKPAGKGHAEVVEVLLKSEVNVRAVDHWGRTALHWSACSGRPITTKMLIDAGALLEAKEWEGRTPLHWTSQSGRIQVIPILLDAGASTAAQDNTGYCPIHLAVESGKQDVLEILLPKSNVDSQDAQKRTPLHIASELGYVSIVKQLLAANATLESKDAISRTPLHYAAGQGNLEVVVVLLEEGCVADSVDGHHQTPLHLAASEGHDDVAAKLMEVRPDALIAEDRAKQTPADVAQSNGHIALAERLEKQAKEVRDTHFSQQSELHKAARRGDMDRVRKLLETETPSLDWWGRTPLHWSAEEGHDEVVELLAATAIDPNIADNTKKTALHLAIENRHERSTKILLGAEVSPDVADVFGRTPLYCAADNGSYDVVHSLLLLSGVSANASDRWGRTAIHQASLNGHVTAVHLLLQHGVDVNAKDLKTRTALQLASKNGHGPVVDELLAQEGVDVNATDGKQRAALHRAAKQGRETVVPRLLNSGADESLIDADKRLPLHLAAGCRNNEVLRRLLRPEYVNRRDKDYDIPLLLAAQTKNVEAVLMLVEAGSDVKLWNGLEQTSLNIAAREGDEAMARALLERYQDLLLVNKLDYFGMHPIAYAAQQGRVELVSLLLDADSDIKLVSDRQWTVLHLAAEKGHEKVVALLLSKGARTDAATYRTRKTPLHVASEYGFSLVVRQLLKAGSDENALTKTNDTPMHLTVRNGHQDVVEELLNVGANIDVRNSDGKTPEAIAKECGWKEIEELLQQSRNK